MYNTHMGSSLNSNPIFQRIKSTSRGPSVTALIWIFALEVVGISFFSPFVFISMVNREAIILPITYVMLAFWAAIMLYPLVTTSAGSMMVNGEIRSESFRVLVQTPLQKSRLYIGYLFGMIYRLRMVITGLGILYITSMIYLGPIAFANIIDTYNCNFALAYCFHRFVWSVVPGFLLIFLVLSYFVYLNLMTIPLVLSIGLRWRKPLVSIIFSSFWIVLLGGFWTYAMMGIPGSNTKTINGQIIEEIVGFPYLTAFCLLLIPLLLNLIMSRLAINHLITGDHSS